MKELVDRYLVVIVAAVAVAVIAAVVVSVVALNRAGDADARANAAEEELVAVRSGVADLVSAAATFTGQINELQPAVSGALDEAIAGLDEFASSSIEFTVPIDESIPIETEFAFMRTITVPVQTVLPIDESVDTTITVQGPLGVEIPLDVTVPVILDLPIDITFPLTVDETIPISTSIPVQLEVPISVDVSDSELATLADSLRKGLTALEEALGGLGG